MGDLLIGIAGSIIGAGVMFIAQKVYYGGKHFGGIMRLIRLNCDCYKAGIINIFKNRNAYTQHKDHGTGAEYIRRCEHSLYYVGYWLASSISMGEIIKTFEELAKKQITITVVFLNIHDQTLVDSCSRLFGITQDELIQRVSFSLKKTVELKDNLEEKYRKYITIKTHNVPISASAFIIEQNDPKRSRILIDYKLYDLCRDETYGIEFQNSNKEITRKAMESYLKISDQAIILK